MADRQYREKGQEKTEEKEEEKHHEKQEKAPEEKWRRDPAGAVVWALILMWAGAVLLLVNLGLLDWLGGGLLHVGDPRVWAVILVGAAVLVLLGVVFRLVVPAYRRPVGGDIVFAAILVAIGVGLFWNWDWGRIWPVLLIVIGGGILLGGLLRRRR